MTRQCEHCGKDVSDEKAFETIDRYGHAVCSDECGEAIREEKKKEIEQHCMRSPDGNHYYPEDILPGAKGFYDYIVVDEGPRRGQQIALHDLPEYSEDMDENECLFCGKKIEEEFR